MKNIHMVLKVGDIANESIVCIHYHEGEKCPLGYECKKGDPCTCINIAAGDQCFEYIISGDRCPWNYICDHGDISTCRMSMSNEEIEELGE